MSEPDIVDTLTKWLDSRLEGVHTCVPAKIVTYSGHKTRIATVQPLVGLLMASGDSVELPVIDNVPVIFPSSQDSAIVFPLKAGDGVLLIFSESGIGNFLASKGTEPVQADDQSRFSLTDAIAIVGLWSSDNSALGDLPEDGLVIAHKSVTLQITDDGVNITASGGLKFTGDLEVTGEITAQCDSAPVKLSTHIHPTAVGPTSPPTVGT